MLGDTHGESFIPGEKGRGGQLQQVSTLASHGETVSEWAAAEQLQKITLTILAQTLCTGITDGRSEG